MADEPTAEEKAAAEAKAVAEAKAAADAAAANGTWHKGLPEDIRSDASLADFKDETEMVSMPVNVARSFINTKKLVGRDKIPMPKTDEEWSDTYNRLGRPESADLYDLPVNETLAEPLKVRLGEQAKVFRVMAHKAGLNAKQATEIFSAFSEVTAADVAQINQNAETEFQNAEVSLRTSYGNSFEGKMVLMNRAMDSLGGQELKELVTATGIARHPAFIKTFVKVGEMMAEDLGLDKSTGELAHTPEALEDERAKLMALPAYIDAKDPAHNATVQKVQRLITQIHGSTKVETTDRSTFITP